MPDFCKDMKDPTCWLIAPFLAPLLPLALLGGCEEHDECDPLTDVQDVAGGWQHTCAVRTSGDVKCWGGNDNGQLGNGAAGMWEGQTRPVDVFELSSGVKRIGAGWKHTCAVLTSGGVKCWGDNFQGQLGNGSMIKGSSFEGEVSPVDVVGLSSGVKDVVGGWLHSCALLASGGVKCWGYGLGGQLGHGGRFPSPTPVDVIGLTSGVQAIAAGNTHTCAILTSGGMKCWGSGFDFIPVDVFDPSSGVRDVAGGHLHTCAVLASGAVKCLGDNRDGQLGDGTTDASWIPVDVVGLSSGVKDVTGGWFHTCALLTSGGVKCWGNNEYGQIGNGIAGEGEYETTPVDVLGLTSDVEFITAGYNHTCAVFTSGDVECWGSNDNGQLGIGIDGAWELETTPVEVCSGP